MMTDPIADLFTRIRNGLQARRDRVDLPNSKIKTKIVEILREEGFIRNFRTFTDDKQGILRVYLKYHEGRGAIQGIQRVSRPGRRVYVQKAEIPRVLNGLGVALVSTSSGLMTDTGCRQKGVGGEVLGHVW
ncbi:MAG: 30S ribosomal protein S8 [Nitrospinaceae bacterium]